MSVVLSLTLGAVLGTLNALVALAVARRASGLRVAQALNLVVGGMVVRMVVVLGAVVAVLLFVPVHRTAFVGALGAVFAVGLAVEVSSVLGRARRAPAPGRPADA